jgi:hypothetical protein
MSSSISVDLIPSPRKAKEASSFARGSIYRQPDKSYFFIEKTGEAIEEKLEEYIVGYTYNIHTWASNPSKRKITSRYLLILKTDLKDGGRQIWEHVRALAEEDGVVTRQTSGGRTFDSLCIDWKDLADLVKKAVAAVSFKTTTYRIPEIML